MNNEVTNQTLDRYSKTWASRMHGTNRLNVAANNLTLAKKYAKKLGYTNYVGTVFRADKNKKGMYQFMRLQK